MSSALVEQVWQALREVQDPELGINIVDLGLVYDVAIEDGTARVVVTRTTPACPLHAYVLEAIEHVLRRQVPQIHEVDVRLVWDPPWHPDMMSPEAKRQLGWEA
jgi:metal-sulfur cluster biosynthetic enzyme